MTRKAKQNKVPVNEIRCLESNNHEQLDFEDENAPLSSTETKPSTFPSKICNLSDENSKDSNYSTSDGESSSGSSTCDEGEMRSLGESDFTPSDRSSEEGEIQSEIEEVDIPMEIEPKKEETPWERGLRLARERMERAKALKATEKDLAEKRMNLSIPGPISEKKQVNPAEENVLWLYYYQASIIGRTELTSRRHLPDDIAAVDESEIVEWRRSVTERHFRRHRSGSNCVSSHSRSSSRSVSSGSTSSGSKASSNVSSLASVAVSWKITCAKALKSYLGSPRRGRRYGRHSSASNSQSSDSRSMSRESSRQHHVGYQTAASGARVSGVTDRSRVYRKTGNFGRGVASGSDHSSASRSRSESSRSHERFGKRGWVGIGKSNKSQHGNPRIDVTGRPNSSNILNRHRANIPPLPNERPVKRPWVATPNLVKKVNMSSTTGAHVMKRPKSPSRSPSPSGKALDEKHFITSWSHSSSSGEGENESDAPRRERLPDVVPGAHAGRTRITASRRKKSRSPFADDSTSALLNNVPQNQSTKQTSNTNYHPPPQADTVQSASVYQSRSSGGELPPNRPGVRLTLAPRLKANVGASSFPVGSGLRTAANRSFQASPPSQPRQNRSVLPPPFLPQDAVTTDSNQAIPSTNVSGAPITQTQVRLQAEAAAAALEVRERRRAAAESARRHRNPRRRKRNDLQNIPVRGRPTYRRQSFSNSGCSDTSASSNVSRSASGARSRSANRGLLVRATSPTMYPVAQKTDDNHRMLPPKRGRYNQSEGRSSRQLTMREANEPNMHYRRQVIPHGVRGNGPPESHDFNEFAHHGRQSDLYSRSGVGMPNMNITRHRTTDQYGVSAIHNKPIHAGKRSYNNGAPAHTNYSRTNKPMQNHPGIDDSRYHNTDIRRDGQLSTAKDRPVRPRTPHGSLNEHGFTRRSPHAESSAIHRPACLDREPQRKINYDIPERLSERSGNASTDFNTQRARSRHRSRGPGVPIDRSEPFESDAGGYAAEQRLRKLRERLNLVDDAIAEIKAGTGTTAANG